MLRGQAHWSIARVGLPRAAADCGRTEPQTGASGVVPWCYVPWCYGGVLWRGVMEWEGTGGSRLVGMELARAQLKLADGGDCV